MIAKVSKQASPIQKRFEDNDLLVATITHELKTPIAAIKLSLNLLEDEQTGILNDQQLDLIKSMRMDSKRLSKMVVELLGYLQVKAKKLELNWQTISSGQLVKEAIDAVAIIAKQKSIDLIVEDQGRSYQLNVDPDKTSRVLINFLTNAIKYSPNHSEVHIKVCRDVETVIFSVSDVGKGINEEDLNKVFNPFFQVAIDSVEKASSGLGLFVCKNVIEAEHGSIWVTSEPENGSTFYFSLPLYLTP